ncbi:hypothetical protein F0562_036082 [Nyssa sinensis]|uniref:F-box domain-containing protein n=1 Tax=Nyssa sinensis TaxID=561372 RepID=A0A5J5AGZ3_9ASTE|nr:hypothetical protein F0562_036082 [Nyssa sinensis]
MQSDTLPVMAEASHGKQVFSCGGKLKRRIEEARKGKPETMASSNTEAVDRISNLPLPIIHHLMSFLPTKDATRTSSLSKRWRSIFYSFPILDFDHFLFECSFSRSMPYVQIREKFLNYLYDSIMLRLDQENNIQKFRFQTNDHDPEFDPLIELSINFSVKRNVQELNISISQSPDQYFTVPQSLYNARSITVLKLTGSKLNLSDLLSGCPQIEHLSLQYCDGLKNIKVSSQKLKTLELVCCQGLVFLEIEAINLESFIYNGDIKPSEVKLTACRFLKTLSMQHCKITENWLEDHISKLLLLENLALIGCITLRKVKIFHKQLRKFHFVACGRVAEVQIDTPMLVSFMYRGHVTFFRSFNSSGLLKATLTLAEGDGTDDWFVNLWEILKFFGHCKVLKLVYISHKDTMFPKDVKDRLLPPLYDLKQLEIEVVKSSVLNYTELVDTSLWLSPLLEMLQITSSEEVKSVKFQYEKIDDDDQEPYCCEKHPIQCWHNHLKKVTMENFDGIDDQKEKLLKYFSENAKLLESVEEVSKPFKVSRRVSSTKINKCGPSMLF